MLKPLPLLAFIALASAGGLHAQTMGRQGDGSVSWRVNGFRPGDRQAKAVIAKPLNDPSGPGAFADRGYAPDYASVGDGEARTAVDYRLAAGGLAGEAGFVCDNDGHAPVLHGVGAAAGVEAGRLFGTTLRYAFK